jgi:hypothetical protein
MGLLEAADKSVSMSRNPIIRRFALIWLLIKNTSSAHIHTENIKVGLRTYDQRSSTLRLHFIKVCLTNRRTD